MPHPLTPLYGPRIRVIDSSADPVARVQVEAEPGPPPIPGGRPKGSKRLHTNATVAAVRRLIEETTLTHKEIAARTGTSAGTVGHWTRDFGWRRHPFAPRASDLVPTARASRRLKLRMLGNRLHDLAERCVTELWNSPAVDLDRLRQAMEVFKMARLHAGRNGRPRRNPEPPARTGRDWLDRDAAIRKALKEMRRGGVNIEHIPDEAMALLEDAVTPPEKDHAAFKARGPRRRTS